jgi:hypothetical protein
LNSNFFKVPVDKLTARISNPMSYGETVKFNESQLGMVDGLENNRFWVHISARRTGKSYAAAILALAKLLEPGQQVIVVAPNYNLSSIIWDYVIGFIRQLNIETISSNQKDKVVKLINESTFRLFSAINRDGLVGRAANLLIIDEAAIIPDDEYFKRDLRPALSTFSDSRALFITTPRGKANYIYDYFLRGEAEEFDDWGSAKYDWTANPLLNKKDIEEARSTISKNMFLQEYYCGWSTYENQIYALDEEKHLVDLQMIKDSPEKFDIIAGLDVGYRDHTAFVVIATDYDEHYYILDEYITKEEITSVIAENISEKVVQWGIDNIYIDSAAQQMKADLAYEYDIYCDNALKGRGSVNPGIIYLQNLIEHDKILFDQDTAYESYKAMDAYRWNPKTEMQKAIHDESSHASDAIRYAIYTYYNGTGSIYTEKTRAEE